MIILVVAVLLAGAVLIGVGMKFSQDQDVIHSRSEVTAPILLSINEPGQGYGTPARCTGALIYVHIDGTVRVVMQTEEKPQVATFTLSQEDTQTLENLVQTSNIRQQPIQEDRSVCDGTYSYIRFYDETGGEVQKIGGYCPANPEFWEVYSGIKDVLRQYPYRDAVEAYRAQMA